MRCRRLGRMRQGTNLALSSITYHRSIRSRYAGISLPHLPFPLKIRNRSARPVFHLQPRPTTAVWHSLWVPPSLRPTVLWTIFRLQLRRQTTNQLQKVPARRALLILTTSSHQRKTSSSLNAAAATIRDQSRKRFTWLSLMWASQNLYSWTRRAGNLKEALKAWLTIPMAHP